MQKIFAIGRDFFTDVAEAGRTGSVPESLRPYAVAGSDEAGAYSDPAGGFFVPSELAPDVLAAVQHDPIGMLVTQIPMRTPYVRITARADRNHSSVSSDISTFRVSETSEVPVSRVAFDQVTLRADTLASISYVTEKLITDDGSAMMTTQLLAHAYKFRERMRWERLHGSGAGEFLGILNSPAVITVDKASGQTANTLSTENVILMASRCWDISRAVWLANQTVRPALRAMTTPVGTGGAPAQMLTTRGDGQELLDNRPIFYDENCPALGSRGDLVLGVWSEYLFGELQPVVGLGSIHVRFLAHERTFKFSTRNAGCPWWLAPMTPRYGGATLSPFVVLADRK